MDEFELIRRYFARDGLGSDVVVGIGDDGAVMRPAAGRELVSVVDALVGGVHFPEGLDAADIGYRAVAVNLSDIAAMGARPRWMTLSLTLPAADPDWLEGFSRGLFAAAGEHDVALVGGDTTQGAIVVVSVQITGDVPAGAAVLRSGARAGDTIYVTGTVGDAAAGLASFGQTQADPYLVRRFLRPTARVGFGQSLPGIASAAIDVSDGLAGDLGKLLAASGCGGRVDVAALPLSPALRSAFDADVARRFALTGGDDYELCFTAGAGVTPPDCGVPVTAIGEVTADRALLLRDQGRTVEAVDGGYRHFT